MGSLFNGKCHKFCDQIYSPLQCASETCINYCTAIRFTRFKCRTHNTAAAADRVYICDNGQLVNHLVRWSRLHGTRERAQFDCLVYYLTANWLCDDSVLFMVVLSNITPHDSSLRIISNILSEFFSSIKFQRKKIGTANINSREKNFNETPKQWKKQKKYDMKMITFKLQLVHSAIASQYSAVRFACRNI